MSAMKTAGCEHIVDGGFAGRTDASILNRVAEPGADVAKAMTTSYAMQACGEAPE